METSLRPWKLLVEGEITAESVSPGLKEVKMGWPHGLTGYLRTTVLPGCLVLVHAVLRSGQREPRDLLGLRPDGGIGSKTDP
jgi:hypothetical protein